MKKKKQATAEQERRIINFAYIELVLNAPIIDEGQKKLSLVISGYNFDFFPSDNNWYCQENGVSGSSIVNLCSYLLSIKHLDAAESHELELWLQAEFEKGQS